MKHFDEMDDEDIREELEHYDVVGLDNLNERGKDRMIKLLDALRKYG